MEEDRIIKELREESERIKKRMPPRRLSAIGFWLALVTLCIMIGLKIGNL